MGVMGHRRGDFIVTNFVSLDQTLERSTVSTPGDASCRPGQGVSVSYVLYLHTKQYSVRLCNIDCWPERSVTTTSVHK
ncbi:hypothetical protein ETAA8_53160 [Anatilimnocola aggregata]|uniref:Uncharacterized protein n=1 Tax=Anatilimnocola aggregata TaxID=2528021 RepID=A0A517YIZ1_9BACT|nr:hypothetical protein ETAA8_53160 [Anatilimnocola aggregata]